MGNEQKAAIYIEPEHVIVNLLAEDKSRYLHMSRLFHFVLYLRFQLVARSDLLENSKIIFDISFDSVERTVRHRNNVFDIHGETILLRGTKDDLDISIKWDKLPDQINHFIKDAAKRYALQFAA